jgi:sulfate-transporting ATPase
MSGSWEVRPGVRREVRLLANFATVFTNDNTENSRQRESMPSLQLPASVTEDVNSPDRWFLDRIATRIIAFEGNFHVEWFEANYEDYEKDRKKRLGADADTPHRIKYRRIDA